jgi:signal transduction histidine kinase
MPDTPQPRRLLSGYMLLAVWLPIALFTVLHFSTSHDHRWVHDVLRRMYYLPILLAAFAAGLRGGLLSAVVVAVLYAPHAFTQLIRIDPAETLEKVLEMLLYLVVGGVAGVLVDRERRRQRQLTEIAHQLREALEEQRHTTDQLIRTGRLAALGELVAGIAHEIKNPLHALRGTAEIVADDLPEGSDGQRMWALHRKEIDRLEGVARRFLSYARPTPPERRAIQLSAVVSRTVELIEAQARQQEVTITVDDLPAGADTEVQADPQQLVQVLLNIALNGLAALGQGGGALRFSISRQPRGKDAAYLLLRVENDGPPIPDDDLERIFDPFVTTKSEGAGLGLSVASRIMEQHGGFIEVQNLDPGPGVAFVVFVPAGG